MVLVGMLLKSVHYLNVFCHNYLPSLSYWHINTIYYTVHTTDIAIRSISTSCTDTLGDGGILEVMLNWELNSLFKKGSLIDKLVNEAKSTAI